MKYRKCRVIFCLAVFGIFLLFCFLDTKTRPYSSDDVKTMLINQLTWTVVSSPETLCKHPRLELWEPSIKRHFVQSAPISCDKESDWICVRDGKANVCNETRTRHDSLHCNYTFLKRLSDHSNEQYERAKGLDSIPVKLLSDFFRVKCIDKKKNRWENIMAGVHYNEQVHQRTGWQHLSDNAMKLNVLMWGFDSLSRLTFERKLPVTFEYLTKELKAIVLKGYNIVGDGTPQALIPILTGKTELELPEVRKRMGDDAQYVNVYPFIWKEYQANGYVTAYAEDCPGIGTFTYRLKGFDQQPTDHYMRNFYVEAEKEYPEHEKYCLRGTPRHKVLMNWVKQFFKMYERKPKFIFTFHSELSHDDYNKVGSADQDLKDLFASLHSEGHLNNTLLIVMSDHGHRFAEFRETQQGKQEERLPFFSFTFPPWFKIKYPEVFRNFQLNQERLTTPFDIHSTLADVLHFDQSYKVGDVKQRSISLFKEVPASRTCPDATIEAHWCACLNKEPISVTDTNATKAAEAAVYFINNVTNFQRELCQPLSLHSLISAEKYIPTKDLLQFKKNADVDGFKPDLSDHTSVSVEMYEVKFHTEPGNGHFEATVKYNVFDNTFDVKSTDISRINKYGKAAACIEHTQPQLRPFCYCKDTMRDSTKT